MQSSVIALSTMELMSDVGLVSEMGLLVERSSKADTGTQIDRASIVPDKCGNRSEQGEQAGIGKVGHKAASSHPVN